MARDYRVYLVAVPGRDMDERNEFTSVEEIAEDIEKAGFALYEKAFSAREIPQTSRYVTRTVHHNRA